MTNVNLQISRITILHRGHGTDIVYIHTTLPTTIVGGDDYVALSVELQIGTGEEWVAEHFGISPDVVSIKG